MLDLLPRAALALLVGCLLSATAAQAAEVVWLNPPQPEDALRVAIRAGAGRGPMTPAEFRALTVDRRSTDDSAIETVEEALRDVRVHERVLDGELLILGGLQTPLQQVRLLRTPRDRDTVVRALLYQGFAVDRYWGDTLATAPEARPWRTRIDDQTVETPWLHAFALDPLRKVGEQDITEAPQRAAYDELRATLARATRATVVAAELPEGARLTLDGEERIVDGPVAIEVIPGRHWIHVELDDQIIGLMDVQIEPAQRLEVQLPVSEADWQALVKVLHGSGTVVPESIVTALQPLGDVVWFAEGRGEQLRVWSVTPHGVGRVGLDNPSAPSTGAGVLGDVSVAAWVGPTWLNSADFRAQDPSAVPDGAGVTNSIAPHAGVELAWDRDWLRYGLGLDLTAPLGSHHVALTGAGALRLRPHPHVMVGHPRLQGTFGLLFPYHLVGGIQGNVPLPDLEAVEVRGSVRVGSTARLTRDDGSAWQGKPIVLVGVGIGGRLRPD